MNKKLLLRLVSLILITGLNVVAAQEVSGVGGVILIEGQVLDVNGEPVVGAVVEIWQTDANGIYNHPNDSDESQLQPDFQYFGTSTTDEDGNYSFRTIKPALYEAMRPPHIHVKVKLEGVELLTTQFYFEEDREFFESDGVFNRGGGESLILQPEETTDENGNPVRLAQIDLVVATEAAGTSGTLPLTPAQSEGPYYPVVDFSGYDNDLTVVEPPFTLLNVNTATAEDFLALPDVDNEAVQNLIDQRPYTGIVQFRQQNEETIDESSIYVPVNVNEADADTLMQIPGVDEEVAEALIAARPYDSNEAFLEKLAEYLSETDVAFAAHYLE